MAFSLLDELGRGPNGTAWRARMEGTGAVVALKPLPSAGLDDPYARSGLWRNVVLARQVVHPSVARVNDIYRLPEGLFLAREHVPGTSLDQLLRVRGPVDAATARKLLRDMAIGLAAIHAVGLLHLDLKPSNVIVDESGSARLTDFALAPALKEMADPAWTAPEGALDARSDLYSLGLVACAMLTGSSPVAGSPDLDRLPAEARPMLAWLLAPRPVDRPFAASQVVAALDGAAAIPIIGRIGPALPPAPRSAPATYSTVPARTPARRTPVLPAVVALAGAAILVVATAVLLSKPTPVMVIEWPTPTVAEDQPTPRPPTISPGPATAPPSPAPTYRVVDPIDTLPPDVVAAFLARIKQDDFAFQAAVVATHEGEAPQARTDSGMAIMNGYDSMLDLKGPDGWTKKSFIGDTVRNGWRDWCCSVAFRDGERRDSYAFWFRSIAGLQDRGLVWWQGMHAHALRAEGLDIGDVNLIDLSMGVGVSALEVQLDFILEADGSLIGMVIEATWTASWGYWARHRMALDYVFTGFSKIAIEPATGEPPPPWETIVARDFVTAAQREGFQFSGRVSGEVTLWSSLPPATGRLSSNLSGNVAMSGPDSSVSVGVAAGGRVDLDVRGVVLGGPSIYRLDASGAWSEMVRANAGGDSIDAYLDSLTGALDHGSITWQGRRVHKLEPQTGAQMSPVWLGLFDADSARITAVWFYCLDGGAPVGMTVEGQWRTTTDTSVDIQMVTLDITFDRLSGVKVVRPPSPTPTPTPTPITNTATSKAFLARIQKPGFQFSGRVTGELTRRSAYNSLSFSDLGGTASMIGFDSDVLIEAAPGGDVEYAFERTVMAGDTMHRRDGPVKWVTSERVIDKTDSMASYLASFEGARDAGVRTWQGRQVHRIEVVTKAYMNPDLLGLKDPGAWRTEYFGPSGRGVDQVTFWCLSDGTPVGMTIEGWWTVEMGGRADTYTANLDIAFDRLSGVKVVPPSP